VLITGEPGGGKTTALRHLAGVVPPAAQVVYFDAEETAEAHQAARSGLAVLAALDTPAAGTCVEVFELSPWTLDDCLEYLVALHRDQCASVLGRLGRDPSLSLLNGSPRLLSLVMDVMAGDPSLLSARDILRHHVRRIIPPGTARDRLIRDGPRDAARNTDVWRWWRHELIRQICVADWICAQLCDGVIPDQLRHIVDRAYLIPEIAAAVQEQPAAIKCLQRLLFSDKRSRAVAMAASILLAADASWRPPDGRELNLSNALLRGARWARVDLSNSLLVGANLAGADLTGADLSAAYADRANLSGAKLSCARMENIRLCGANLFSADLSNASASNAHLSQASLEAINARKTVFRDAIFIETNLSSAQCDSSDFSGASFSPMNLNEADFSGANFTGTKFLRLDLSEANWTGASFAGAELIDCNLEGLEMEAADFEKADLTGSLLTGSRMPRGNFRGANLTRTGLADIDWTNADLRGANFAEASFHMGSTRSGLVGSTIPSEGSRTGFYTDDYNDQTYKSPEEIRKACLCGANLIGAEVERTDFYLVDLRGAIYSKSQAEHFTRSGAILRQRNQ